MNKISKNLLTFIVLIAVSFGIYCMVNHSTGNSIVEASIETNDENEDIEVSSEIGTAPNTEWGYWW